jgi:hypothetical protein
MRVRDYVIRDEDTIHIVQDRDQWQAVVNKTINCRVENLLTSRATVRFSRILLHRIRHYELHAGPLRASLLSLQSQHKHTESSFNLPVNNTMKCPLFVPNLSLALFQIVNSELKSTGSSVDTLRITHVGMHPIFQARPPINALSSSKKAYVSRRWPHGENALPVSMYTHTRNGIPITNVGIVHYIMITLLFYEEIKHRSVVMPRYSTVSWHDNRHVSLHEAVMFLSFLVAMICKGASVVGYGRVLALRID